MSEMIRRLYASPHFPTLVIMSVFAVTAAISQCLFQQIETRLQIGAFVIIAMMFEVFGRRAVGQRWSAAGLAWNCFVIVMTMTSAKIAIEGPHMGHWIRHMRSLVEWGINAGSAF